MTTIQNENFPCQEVSLFLDHSVVLCFAHSLPLCPLKFDFCYTSIYVEG